MKLLSCVVQASGCGFVSDLNGDGSVGSSDLLALLSEFGSRFLILIRTEFVMKLTTAQVRLMSVVCAKDQVRSTAVGAASVTTALVPLHIKAFIIPSQNR